MKKLLILCSVFCTIILGLFSCNEKNLDVYEEKSSIYFVQSENNDGEFLSFGYVSSYVKDSIVTFLVRATGKPEDFNRPYHIVISKESTMKEGVDFEFVDSKFTMEANRMTDRIQVRVLRTEKLRDEEHNLHFELLPNEHFSTELYSRKVGTGDNQQTRIYTKRYLRVDDIAGIPWFWDETQNASASIFKNYLGEYSPAKFQLIIGRFNIDVEEAIKPNYRPAVTALITWGRATQAYLNEMTANGTPILEADGTPMKMGNSVQ